MYSGSGDVARFHFKPGSDSPRPLQNGLKVHLLPLNTKKTKTNSTKSNRPKSAVGDSSRQPDLIPPSSPVKPLVNGNHGKPISIPNDSPAKSASKSRTASPTKLLNGTGGGGGGGKNSLHPPTPNAMAKSLFFPPSQGASNVFNSTYGGFNPENGRRAQQNGNSEVASKISEIIGATRKILPAVASVASGPPKQLLLQDPKIATPQKIRKEPVPIRPAGGTDSGQKALPILAEPRSQTVVVSTSPQPVVTYPFIQPRPAPPVLLAPIGTTLMPFTSSVIYPGTAQATTGQKRQISPSPPARTKSVVEVISKAKPASTAKKRKNSRESGPSKKSSLATAVSPKVITVNPVLVQPTKTISPQAAPVISLLPAPSIPPLAPAPMLPPPGPPVNLFATTITTTASSNDDFDQLLTRLQDKISTQEFSGGGGSSNALSPSTPRSLSSSGAQTPALDRMTSLQQTRPLSAEELREKLRKVRKATEVVDLALEEDVVKLTAAFEKILLGLPKQKIAPPVPAKSGAKSKSPTAKTANSTTALPSVMETIPEPSEEPVCVLPFKKRQYRGVPSPKTKDTNETKSGKDGRDRSASTSNAGKGKDAAALPTSPSSSSSPKQPSIKLSLRLNHTTGKAYPAVMSPQSSVSVSSFSPKSTSTSPATAAGLSSPKLTVNLKKRKSDGANEGTSMTPSTKRKNSTARPADGDYTMTCNSYSEARLRKPHRDTDLMQCDCRPPPADQPEAVGCGEDCMSRHSFIECDPSLCRCGSRCSNQTIQMGLGVLDLELFATKEKGQGVRSRSDIKKGSFICEYVGEVVSMEKFRDRMKREDYSGAAHHYCLKLDGDKVIDAYRCGGIARFINHACEPNSQTQKWLVNGQDRMAIFASQDIPAGQEITYDYKFESFDMQQKCFCGAKACRGFTGIKTSQKLNGLLMKKRQPSAGPTPSPSSTVSQKSSVPPPPPVMMATKPTKLLAMPNGIDLPEIPTEFERDKRMMILERICLPRNLRGFTKNGRKANSHRPKIPRFIGAKALPKLAAKTVAELFPAAKLFPAEYFKPEKWEPSRAEIDHYTRFGKEEVIRCTCNIFMEDNTMVECDDCKVWQHCECVGLLPEKTTSYKCDKCLPRNLPLEIHHNLPAASNPDDLNCYVTLRVPNYLDFYVRVGDCVYLTKDRKPPLPGVLYDPLTVDIIHIDKMWIDSQDVRQVFGNHYLRPHETFHEANRKFFPNEVLKSQHLETVRLEAVLGRCCIMDSITYAEGKPKEYPLQHCLICDNKVNKTNQFFRLATKDRIQYNYGDSYYFEKYRDKLVVRRTLRPHQVPTLKKWERKKSDALKTESVLVRERCLRVHSVLEMLGQRASKKSLTTANQQRQSL